MPQFIKQNVAFNRLIVHGTLRKNRLERCVSVIASRQKLALADGASGARAEGGAVVVVLNTEGAEHALGSAAVHGVSARGPASSGGAAEVAAVVPGGAGVAAVGGGVGDGGSRPLRGEEGLEVNDVREL